MASFYTIICLSIIALIFFLILRIKNKLIPAVIAKSIVSILFIATAVICAYINTSESFSSGKLKYIGLILLGLLAGLMGDIWLDLKYCYPANDKIYTYAGFISFAIGHILYLSALISQFAFDFKNIAIAIVAGIIGALLTFFSEKIMKLDYGKFKITAALYVFIMCTMTFYAANVCIFVELKKTALVVAVGGILFILSDFILSATYFGKGKNRSVDIISNHVLYYMAQFVIASSILFVE